VISHIFAVFDLISKNGKLLYGRKPMIRNYIQKCRRSYTRNGFFLFLTLFFAAAVVFAHGGKVHEMGEFTHLAALEKATELYDKLIDSQKLDPAWETGLERVEVSHRQKGNDTEVVVAFHRDEGDPKTVFIFFTPKGEYAGSIFTGE
jgi:hypothetical protein